MQGGVLKEKIRHGVYFYIRYFTCDPLASLAAGAQSTQWCHFKCVALNHRVEGFVWPS